MVDALIALGSNVGDRGAHLHGAAARLAACDGVEVVAVSRFHGTRPVGGPRGQGEFLNAAARLRTTRSPGALLAVLRNVEEALGRTRDIPWGPRTLDLDLLLYGDLRLNLPELQLPHPRMGVRRFVLDPAVEVAPAWIHPVFQASLAELRQRLATAPPNVLVAAATAAERKTLLAYLLPLLEEQTAADSAAPGARLWKVIAPEFASPADAGLLADVARHARLAVLLARHESGAEASALPARAAAPGRSTHRDGFVPEEWELRAALESMSGIPWFAVPAVSPRRAAEEVAAAMLASE